MKRREFILSTAAGAVLSAATPLGSAEAAPGRKPVLMKLGCQSGPTSDQRLQFFARHGVRNICGAPEAIDGKRGAPSVEELSRLKERAAKWEINIDMLTPPFLAS